MNWFYAAGGQQQGPVDDAQLDALLQSGQINQETLVWKEGMPNWQPLRQARPASPATLGAPPVITAPHPGGTGGSEVVCAECGKIFTKDNVIQYGSTWVCATCKPIFVQKLKEGTATGTVLPGIGEIRYAGFWIRFVAKFIDNIILAIPGFILGMGSVFVIGAGGPNPNSPIPFIISQIALSIVNFAISIAYNGLFVGKYGATPGKMAVGLKVVNADGSMLSYGRSFGRAAAEIVSSLTCAIGYIIAAFDDQKRSLHDHICSTRVIYK